MHCCLLMLFEIIWKNFFYFLYHLIYLMSRETIEKRSRETFSSIIRFHPFVLHTIRASRSPITYQANVRLIYIANSIVMSRLKISRYRAFFEGALPFLVKIRMSFMYHEVFITNYALKNYNQLILFKLCSCNFSQETKI